MRLLLSALAAVCLGVSAAGQAYAADPHPFVPDSHNARPAEIPFANLGGIDDWRAAKDALFIKSSSGRYYRATFIGPCPELPFAERIGFVTEPDGGLDKWSSVYVDGDRCWFRAFDEVSEADFDSAH